jgi:hypothetical protein
MNVFAHRKSATYWTNSGSHMDAAGPARGWVARDYARKGKGPKDDHRVGPRLPTRAQLGYLRAYRTGHGHVHC